MITEKEFRQRAAYSVYVSECVENDIKPDDYENFAASGRDAKYINTIWGCLDDEYDNLSSDDIKDILYEIYKQAWIEDNTTQDERENLILDWLKYNVNEVEDKEDMMTLDEYREEFGYKGSLYVCFDEFLQNEFRDFDWILGIMTYCNANLKIQLLRAYRNAVKES